MRTMVATAAGSTAVPSEDQVIATDDLIVVVDGATARTDTGCIHGTAWYADRLAHTIAESVAGDLAEALASAITRVADLHRDTCDLTHPGTPGAAVGIVQVAGPTLRYLVLGDITVIIDTADGLTVVADERVSTTAAPERRAADGWPIGSAEKSTALRAMKHAELASRNKPGGYWFATSDPAAADHALTGTFPLTSVARGALLSDGATRAVNTLGLLDWPGLVDFMEASGPEALIAKVRAAEASDPSGVRWPRNKASDDATAVYFSP